jgi:hypothetical protein
MSFENFMKSRGVSFNITSSGKLVAYESDPRSSYYSSPSYSYTGSVYAPPVGGAIGLRGSLPRFLRISTDN